MLQNKEQARRTSLDELVIGGDLYDADGTVTSGRNHQVVSRPLNVSHGLHTHSRC
jgi:hypothetical protein